MRFRGKSIRRKIVALLLVPLVSLTAIWAFSTVITGRAATQLVSAGKVADEIGYPISDAARTLQDERRQTLVYLADPRASDALSKLRSRRSASDEAMAQIRTKAENAGIRDDMSDDSRRRIGAVVEGFDGIESLRRNVDEGTVTREQALDFYNRLIDPTYDFLLTLSSFDNSAMDRQGRAVIGVLRARELLSREDALVGSALVARRITHKELRQVSDLVAQRGILYETSLALLPGDDRAEFERYWKSADTAALRTAENTLADSTAGTPRGVTARAWNNASGQVLDELVKRDTAATERYQDRARPVAINVFLQAGVAGVLGLLALLLSLFLSVRIGRSLVRDLRRLRLEAHEASGVRLPSVMRRLAAGEHVDVETEAPRLEYDKNEIGQVGQALNTLQRSAVEAAVKQAELRHGVSEVFVNLARRSQVLLHKQLTLLDTMERRTEDTDELADLFRLDHLTTRMRRHAEGLVILSGAAPSRQWRRPVQLMDIVRASVAEVEDYERVEVRRLPRIAVTGPAVADLTHLVAELLENATVFSPPHTAVHVVGERVANGFTLEIHDRGLGMAADALLDANLRLAETPEFELSDTDRLGLFVVSRLAQRQNVRVSLQPSPYGGTTAIVFIPDTLLTDAPDTEGAGFRLDRPNSAGRGKAPGVRSPKLSTAGSPLPGLPASLLDGPVELEAPLAASDLAPFPGALDDEDSERGGLFRPRRRPAGLPGEQHQHARDDFEDRAEPTHRAGGPDGDDAPVPLPRRRAPKLVSSHGRPVTHTRPGESESDNQRTDGRPENPGSVPRDPEASTPDTPGDAYRAEAPEGPRERRLTSASAPDLPRRRARAEASEDAAPARRPEPVRDPAPEPADDAPAPSLPSGLPRRVRQANLAPQLKEGPDLRADRAADREGPNHSDSPAERDADEVRNRMASLQRGWRRGREENAAGDDASDGTAQGTTSEGDGR
ncbi:MULTISPECIES: sensor histidine kinase [unclassified Streptomyces]|uniref:sensor histidine kinase n=1 Tax=unclassified Streptomyces TaxID=2593676 RepID=UPI002DD8ECF0|nr:nitrate- and nitrite sensing domain-containing protein [Streptomyces sp. NBC_01445]WSE08526.1 nitrate- and nitrite sensing domain-containing protein [Streptomyces sp. NBC_01445]